MHYIVKLCKYIYLRRRKNRWSGSAGRLLRSLQLVAFFLHPLGHLFCARLLDGLPLVALPLLPSAPLLLASCELLELVSLPWSIQNPRAKKTPSR